MRPGPRLHLLAAAWTIAAVPAALWPGLVPAWAGLGAALALVATLDARALRATSLLRAVRRIPATLSLDARARVGIRIENEATSAIRLDVFDHHPGGDDVERLPIAVTVPARSHAVVDYDLVPRARGVRRFGHVESLALSPLGIWRRHLMLGTPETVRVFPNFAYVSRYLLLATQSRVAPTGVRRRRRRGEGLDFHQLRDYRDGDSLRQIDWKATSRVARLISREYQEERDQQVVFLLDCGHRMRSKDDALSHFDHGLNAIMLLAHVALRQGDAVGVTTFAGTRRHLPPQKGAGAMQRVLELVFDLEPTLAAPDYLAAATDLMRVVRRRALVVLVTNLRDEDADEVLPALALLRRRHLVLVGSLREQVIGRMLEGEVEDFDAALRVAAAHRYLLGRRKLHDAIAEHGVLSLDVEPARFPPRLVNRYLEVKGSGRL